MNWKTGDKAVAICGAWRNAATKGDVKAEAGTPVKGTIYLVSGVETRANGRTVLYLAALPCSNQVGIEGGWSATGFRKIVPLSERRRQKASLSNVIGMARRGRA